MGRDSKEKRTKGNLQPSSSSRAAESLEVSALVASVGFNPFNRNQDDSLLLVDPNVLANLKRINKKDPVTRQKALEQLLADLENLKENEEGLKAVVKLWPRLYSKCVYDSHRYIRELSQKVLLKFTEINRKAISLILKDIGGYWLCSWFDPLPTVSKLGIEAFNQTFPENKRDEAITFLADTLFAFNKTVLFETTIEDLKKQAGDLEDIDYKFARIIGSCVKLIGFLINKYNANYSEVLNDERFWKLIKADNNGFLRKCFYQFVSTTVKNSQLNDSHIANYILAHCLKEKEWAQENWECLVMISAHASDSWFVQIAQKPLLNQLQDLISNAPGVDAGVIYPCVLPILSGLSRNPKFSEANCKNFMLSVWSSLHCERMEKLYYGLFIKCFNECVQFVAKKGPTLSFSMKPYENYLEIEVGSKNQLDLKSLELYNFTNGVEEHLFGVYKGLLESDGVLAFSKKSQIKVDLQEFSFKLIQIGPLVKYQSLVQNIRELFLKDLANVKHLNLLFLWYKHHKNELEAMFLEAKLLDNLQEHILSYIKSASEVDLVALMLTVEPDKMDDYLAKCADTIYRIKLQLLMFEYSDYDESLFEKLLPALRDAQVIDNELVTPMLRLLNHIPGKALHHKLCELLCQRLQTDPQLTTLFEKLEQLPLDLTLLQDLYLHSLRMENEKLEKKVVSFYHQILNPDVSSSFFDKVLLNFGFSHSELVFEKMELLLKDKVIDFVKYVGSLLSKPILRCEQNLTFASMFHRAFGKFTMEDVDPKADFWIELVSHLEALDSQLLIPFYSYLYLEKYYELFDTITQEIAKDVDHDEVLKALDGSSNLKGQFVEVLAYYLNQNEYYIVNYLLSHSPGFSVQEVQDNKKRLLLCRYLGTENVERLLESKSFVNLIDMYIINEVSETKSIKFDQIEWLLGLEIDDLKLWNEVQIFVTSVINSRNWIVLDSTNQAHIERFMAMLKGETNNVKLYRTALLLSKLLHYNTEFYESVAIPSPSYFEDFYDAFYDRFLVELESANLGNIKALIPLVYNLPTTFKIDSEALQRCVNWMFQYDDIQISCALFALMKNSIGSLKFKDDESASELIQYMDFVFSKEISNLSIYILAMILMIEAIAHQESTISIIQWIRFNYREQVGKFLSLLVNEMKSVKIDLNRLDLLQFDVQSKILINAGYSFTTPSDPIYMAAFYTFGKFLEVAPALTRFWFMDQTNRTVTSFVESLAEKYYSKSLITMEIQRIQSYDQKQLVNTTFRVLQNGSSGYNVHTLYKVDEAQMEVILIIPNLYPLRQVTVDEGGQRVGVTEAKWRQWKMSLQTNIANQNMGVLDALLLWKQNADKRFEGIEDCPICYSVVQNVDRSLPSQTCKTCKHKFHSLCLFKWFKSSNQSTCPLCRSYF